MNAGLLRAIRERLAAQADEELVRLWVENDRGQYSDEMFEAVRSLLAERRLDLPPQNDPPPIAEHAPPRDLSAVERDPSAAFWLRWLRTVLWIGAALSFVQLLAYCLSLSRFLRGWAARGRLGTWDWLGAPGFISLAQNIGLAIWLMVAVWLGLRLRPRARVALLVYAAAALLAAVVSVARNLHAALSFGDGGAVDILYAAVLSVQRLQDMVYPVILLLLLTRPQIRELFEPSAAGFEVSATGPGAEASVSTASNAE